MCCLFAYSTYCCPDPVCPKEKGCLIRNVQDFPGEVSLVKNTRYIPMQNPLKCGSSEESRIYTQDFAESLQQNLETKDPRPVLTCSTDWFGGMLVAKTCSNSIPMHCMQGQSAVEPPSLQGDTRSWLAGWLGCCMAHSVL